MTWLDKGLRPLACLRSFFRASLFDMTWLDKGLRLVVGPKICLLTHSSLIWPDLIRDYDRAGLLSWTHGRRPRFDMTWLDKGLRQIKSYRTSTCFSNSLIWPDLIRDYDAIVDSFIDQYLIGLIWPDLIRDYDIGPKAGGIAGVQLFDMTWLDKGLRHNGPPLRMIGLPGGLIWPDLIRDYDRPSNDGWTSGCTPVWYDLTW